MAKDDIDGQVSADLEFARRAQELLRKLRRFSQPPPHWSQREQRDKEKGSSAHPVASYSDVSPSGSRRTS
jgi:hypothetical protein